MKHNILVVEDESIVALDLKQRLLQMGHSVTAIVSNGAAALESVASCQPNLILMDIQIKGDIDGIETAEQIQKQLDVPIVFLSANSDAATMERAKETKPLAYLLKPFDDKELKVTIDIALNRHQLEQRVRKSESWLQAVLNNIGDAVIATDRDGTTVFANEVASRLTGWTTDEIVSQDSSNTLNLTCTKTGEPVNNPISRCLDEAAISTLPVDTECTDNEGNSTIVEGCASPIRDSQGAFIGCVLVLRDVAESRKAETMVMAYQEQLEGLLAETSGELEKTTADLGQEVKYRQRAEVRAFDLSRFPDENPDPVLRITEDGKLVYANRASQPLLDSWKCEVNESVPEAWQDIVAKSLDLGVRTDIEIEVEERKYLVAIAPILRSRYVNFYGRDITDLRTSRHTSDATNECVR